MCNAGVHNSKTEYESPLSNIIILFHYSTPPHFTFLNAYSETITASKMISWQYDQDEDFEYSCGKMLPDCPFLQNIANALRKNSLPFDFRQCGTSSSLVSSETVDHANIDTTSTSNDFIASNPQHRHTLSTTITYYLSSHFHNDTSHDR